MSDKTWRELRTIWTGETCDALDAHVKCVVAESMAAHTAEHHVKSVGQQKSVRVRVHDVVDEKTGDVRLDCEVLPTEPPPAEAGDDELRKAIFDTFYPYCINGVAPRELTAKIIAAIGPMFDALRRERDKWREGALQECQLRKDRDNEVRRWQQLASDNFWAWQGDGTDNLESLTCAVHIMPAELLAIVKRAEAAESALAELRAAIKWRSKQKIRISGHIYPDPPHDDSDAIIASYRASKVASDSRQCE